MIVSLEDAVYRLSERVVKNHEDIRQAKVLRRNQAVDIYGDEFYRQGDNDAPASFYVSVSKDMVYMERFEFKLIIQPFTSTVSKNTVSSATVTVDDTELEINEARTQGTPNEEHTHTITPNPHTHETLPHTHTVVPKGGISQTQVTAGDFRISIEGVDITPYLMAQYDGEWIDGEGVFPSLDIDEEYDILEVISDMTAEGRDTSALTRPGYKLVQVSASGPFACTMVLYLKYNHMNR